MIFPLLLVFVLSVPSLLRNKFSESVDVASMDPKQYKHYNTLKELTDIMINGSTSTLYFNYTDMVQFQLSETHTLRAELNKLCGELVNRDMEKLLNQEASFTNKSEFIDTITRVIGRILYELHTNIINARGTHKLIHRLELTRNLRGCFLGFKSAQAKVRRQENIDICNMLTGLFTLSGDRELTYEIKRLLRVSVLHNKMSRSKKAFITAENIYCTIIVHLRENTTTNLKEIIKKLYCSCCETIMFR